MATIKSYSLVDLLNTVIAKRIVSKEDMEKAYEIFKSYVGKYLINFDDEFEALTGIKQYYKLGFDIL